MSAYELTSNYILCGRYESMYAQSNIVTTTFEAKHYSGDNVFVVAYGSSPMITLLYYSYNTAVITSHSYATNGFDYVQNKTLEMRSDSNGLYVNEDWLYTTDGSTHISDEVLIDTDIYSSYSEAIQNIIGRYPITYRLTNCTTPSAPTEAIVGYEVNVTPQFTPGYGVVNPASDVYVTCNGVLVPSTYANGTLTFTMPDPS